VNLASLDKYKLTQDTWDSDANPGKLLHFVTNMGAMVRAINHGSTLEDYLNLKLGRNVLSHVTTPSFLADDPDFVLANATNAEINGDASVSNLSSDPKVCTSNVSNSLPMFMELPYLPVTMTSPKMTGLVKPMMPWMVSLTMEIYLHGRHKLFK
jgi:hypothetical protein